jgi:hypothetical protein
MRAVLSNSHCTISKDIRAPEHNSHHTNSKKMRADLIFEWGRAGLYMWKKIGLTGHRNIWRLKSDHSANRQRRVDKREAEPIPRPKPDASLPGWLLKL